MQLFSLQLFLILQIYFTTGICVDVDDPDYVEIKEADMIYYVNRGSYTRAGGLNRFNESLSLLWPNNTVIFKFAVGTPDQLKSRVYSGMDDLTKALKSKSNPNESCLKFKEYTSADLGKHYTTIYRNSNYYVCSSTVGFDRRAGQKQSVNLGDGCDPAALVHELTHTLGFFHEHTRNDRDNYIYVDINKVSCGLQYNFVKDADRNYDTTYYGVPYNYESIMHYRLNAFAKNSSDPAMIHRCNRNGYGWQNNIEINGNDIYLSYGDLLMIARRYGCVEPKPGDKYVITNNTGRPLPKNNCKTSGPITDTVQTSTESCRSNE